MTIQATGGTLTTYTQGVYQYNVHTFSVVGSDTLVITSGSGNVDYLIVAGGGAGSYGGGGGGGVLTGTFAATPGSYSVVVGNGGAAATAWQADLPDNGGNSSIFGFSAIGGGHGGVGYAGQSNGTTGGSGGGGAYASASVGSAGAGTSGQGYGGGLAASGLSGSGGGGGGAGGPGGNSGSSIGSYGGAGGVGVQSNISGVSTYYGGGGGGSLTGLGGVYGGIGGNGGGGNGCGVNASYVNIPGTAGTNGLGGGGGGSGQNAPVNALGYAGGSGVVILRYATNAPVDAWLSLTTFPQFTITVQQAVNVVGAMLSANPYPAIAAFAAQAGRVFFNANPFPVFSAIASDGLPLSAGDFGISLVWRGCYVANGMLVIPYTALDGLTTVAANAASGDGRDVFYRILKRAAEYYASLPTALQAKTGRVAMFDDIHANDPQFGATNRKQFVVSVNINPSLGGIEEEPT